MSQFLLKDKSKLIKSISLTGNEAHIELIDGSVIVVRAINGDNGPEVEADYEDDNIRVTI